MFQLKKLEQELQHANEELQKSKEEIGDKDLQIQNLVSIL